MRRVASRHSPRQWRRLEWRPALLVAAVLLTYANSLSGPFVLDDQAAIVQNPSIRGSWLAALRSPAPDSPVAGRPVANLSFALNYAAGGLDVLGYHVVNIALHAACAWLAYLFLRLTLELPRVRAQVMLEPRTTAFAVTLVWAVHPLNSEVVNYLSQRTESLMAVCYLGSIVCSARAASTTRRRWTLAAVLICAVGTLCKESMATAPLVVMVYDRVFLFGSWRDALRSRWMLYVGLASSWAVLGAVLALSPRGAVAGFGSGVSPWTYLLNQALIITEYLRLSFWPDTLVAFYGWPMPLSIQDVWPQASFLVGLLLASVIALVRWPLVGFAGIWFFVTLAPASSIVPVATEVGAERRMYLPLLAVVAVVLVGATVVARRWRFGARAIVHAPSADVSRERLRIAGYTGLGAIVLALSVVTVARNREYRSALTLTRTIVERRPTAVGHHMFAEQLSLAGRAEEAVPHLQQALEGGNSRAGYLLGVIEFNRGDVDEAIARLDAFVKTAGVPRVPRWLEPPTDEILRARVALGLAFLQRRNWTRAEQEANAALAVAPRYVEAHAVRAHALFGQERWADAASAYETYVMARPVDVEALLNLGVSLVATERLPQALPIFRRAVTLAPSNARARRLLALAQEDAARGAR